MANWDVTTHNWWSWNPISALRMSSPIPPINPCAPWISRHLQVSHIYSEVALSLTSWCRCYLSTVSLKNVICPGRCFRGSYYCSSDDPHHDSIYIYAKGISVWVPNTPIFAFCGGGGFWAEAARDLSNFAHPLLPSPEATLLIPGVSKGSHGADSSSLGSNTSSQQGYPPSLCNLVGKP